MLTYILLNILFLLAVLIMMRRILPATKRPWYLTLLILVVMTAVFDNIIIILGIVDYNPNKILGIYIYKAPIEDFFYALLAVYIVPALWRHYEKPTQTKGTV